jgi:hypothetical protein
LYRTSVFFACYMFQITGACNFKLKLPLEFCALSTVTPSNYWAAFLLTFFFFGLQTKVASVSPDTDPGTGLPRIFLVQIWPRSPNKTHHLQIDFLLCDQIFWSVKHYTLLRLIHTQHAVPLPCCAVNSYVPRRAPATLRQCRIVRESPRGSRKYPNC